MSVFRYPKILRTQALDRTAILNGDHNVENDDPFICPEDAVSVLSHRPCSLAVQSRAKDAAETTQEARQS